MNAVLKKQLADWKAKQPQLPEEKFAPVDSMRSQGLQVYQTPTPKRVQKAIAHGYVPRYHHTTVEYWLRLQDSWRWLRDRGIVVVPVSEPDARGGHGTSLRMKNIATGARTKAA